MDKWYEIIAKSDGDAEILIYDDIGKWGVNAKQFISDLSRIKSKSITLRINSDGGDAIEAFAIYNAIRASDATITCRVDGIAASAASIIAVAGDRLCMCKNSYIMIHEARAGTFGDVAELTKLAGILAQLNDSCIQMYAEKSGKPAAEIKKLMADETWFNAKDAKSFGLCDEIADEVTITDSRAAAMQAALKYPKAPEALRKFAASLIPVKEAPKMAETIYVRDGKNYVKVNGVETEVNLSGAITPPATVAAPVASGGLNQSDVDKAVAAALAADTQYRADFRTAVAASGMTGKAAEEFEKKFFKRPIEDIKFLASNAIGSRAVAVGEGGGAADPVNTAEAADKLLVADVTKRFEENRDLRMSLGVRTDSADSPEYKAGLEKMIKGERRWQADQKRQNKTA